MYYKPKEMNILNFEDFIEICWDYVSENIVSDDYWEKEQDFIQEITFTFYQRYKKNLDGLSPKQYGSVFEAMFKKIQEKENNF